MFSLDDRRALDEIRALIESERPTDWTFPDEYAAKAFEIAEMAVESPATALEMANSYIEKLIAFNVLRQNKLAKARKLRSDLTAREEEQKQRAQTRWLVKFGESLLFWRWRIWRLPSALMQRIKLLFTRKNDQVEDETAPIAAGLSGKERIEKLQYTISKTDFKRTPPPDPNTIVVGAEPFAAPVKPAVVDHGFKLPITNAGSRGIRGLLGRWLLATLNATPTSGLNWMEVTKDGLQIYQPLATVSQRTIKHPQLQNQLVISVNPPAYFDAPLGLLKQFFADITTPWGEIVLYEGGGAKVVASAIAFWPAAKIKEIRAALELLHLANNEHEGFRRIPRLRDMFLYFNPDQVSQPTPPPTADLNNVTIA